MTDRNPNSRIGIALVCVLAASVCSCVRAEAESERAAAQAETQLVVPVARAARVDLSTDVVLTAEFQPFQQIDVMAKIAGYVKSISVDIGDRVRQGQVLAVLEIPEMDDDLARTAATVDQADAEITTHADELRRAEAAYRMVHLSYTRVAEVSRQEPGLVPQQELDEAQSRDLVAEAQTSAARSALHTARQRVRVTRADHARLETLRKYTTISAPFDGVVTKRYANAGAMVQAGTASQTQAMPVVQLSQNHLLRLILPVPESVVSRVHVGQTVGVRVSSLGETFPGRVARFAGKIQEATRTMETEVDVANPALRLIPGMYAEVRLRVDQRSQALTVPLEAVDRGGASPRVYTVTAGTVHTLNVMSLMGVVMLAGVAMSNSILIVEFAHRMRDEGMSAREAVSMACHVRLRPILMTSLATIIGLLPMALKMGEGSESYAPLARTLIGGLGASVCLTVFLIPAAFCLAYDKQKPAVRSAVLD